jgi:uncharacterized caspase-like protein
MELRNPVNDAHAVRDLLTSAGFSVDLQLEVTQRAFIEAIERFGKTIKRGGTKLAIFFYAGHGVQLDWRNYLLPVDAQRPMPFPRSTASLAAPYYLLAARDIEKRAGDERSLGACQP